MRRDVWHTLHLPRPAFASVCGAISIEHQIVDFRRLCEWKVRIAHRATVGNSLSLRLNNGLVLRGEHHIQHDPCNQRNTTSARSTRHMLPLLAGYVRPPTSCRTQHTQSPTRSSHTHSPAPCTGLTRRRRASCASAYTWGEWAQQRALTRMQGKPTHARRVGWQTCIWDSMCGR